MSKQTIVSISKSNEARETKNLLKYINNILNRSMFLKKSLFLEEYLLKLHKNLKNILKEYNEIASNDSNVAESFFYINKVFIYLIFFFFHKVIIRKR